MDKNMELVKELSKLQVLCVKWVERNTSLRCSTYRDMDRLVMGGKLTITYSKAVEILKGNIEKYCKDSAYLVEAISKLELEIKESEIANLRFGHEPPRKFTELEHKLDTCKLQSLLFMQIGLVGIAEMSKLIGISPDTIKSACQAERLLNTQKVGKSWLVHIAECRSYWNIPSTEGKGVYKDWEY